jgi:hypothetical protein
MNQYLYISRNYFNEFEGMKLYPSPKTRSFWFLLSSVVVCIVGFLYTENKINWSKPTSLLVLIVSEFILILAIMHTQEKKKQKTLENFNLKRKTRFSDVEKCKSYLLSDLLRINPSSFLTVAKEIMELKNIEKTLRRSSERFTDNIGRFIFYDSAKERISNYLLALFATLLAILVASGIKLDDWFDVVFSSEYLHQMQYLFIISMFLFLMGLGFLFILMFASETAMNWWIRLPQSKTGSAIELDYMMRDLIRLHTRPPMLG